MSVVRIVEMAVALLVAQFVWRWMEHKSNERRLGKRQEHGCADRERD